MDKLIRGTGLLALLRATEEERDRYRKTCDIFQSNLRALSRMDLSSVVPLGDGFDDAPTLSVAMLLKSARDDYGHEGALVLQYEAVIDRLIAENNQLMELMAQELETQAKAVPIDATFCGGGLHDTPKFDVMMWAARWIRERILKSARDASGLVDEDEV
jgi:predicted mannosyl-3-phosphoglycerate phosphatase (HAD superfamily)